MFFNERFFCGSRFIVFWLVPQPQQKLLEENPFKSSPEVFVENRINHGVQCGIAIAKPKRQTKKK